MMQYDNCVLVTNTRTHYVAVNSDPIPGWFRYPGPVRDAEWQNR
jgi:hypothetical protein